MASLKMSNQGKKLIKLYEKIVSEGYDRQDGIRVKSTYNDFELKNLETSVKNRYHIVALEQF